MPAAIPAINIAALRAILCSPLHLNTDKLSTTSNWLEHHNPIICHQVPCFGLPSAAGVSSCYTLNDAAIRRISWLNLNRRLARLIRNMAPWHPRDICVILFCLPYCFMYIQTLSPPQLASSFPAWNNSFTSTPSAFAIAGRYSALMIFRPFTISLNCWSENPEHLATYPCCSPFFAKIHLIPTATQLLTFATSSALQVSWYIVILFQDILFVNMFSQVSLFFYWFSNSIWYNDAIGGIQHEFWE